MMMNSVHQTVGKSLLESVRVFLQTYRQYLLLPVAILAIALGMVLGREKRTCI